MLALLSFMLLSLLGQAREYDIRDYLNPNNPERKAYIEKYKDIAIMEMHRSGIPASIKLAQGILESGDGKSTLAREAHNHFGMKCGADWDGGTYYLEDDDHDTDGNLIKSCFRTYEKPEDSYRAHSEFLLNPKKVNRYGYLFDLDIRDYKAWAKGLKAAGYATNPNYARLLTGLIEANNLQQYDQEVFFDLLAQPLPQQPSTHTPGTPSLPDHIAVNEVLLNNGKRMIFAQKGDTPASIENFFGVDAKKITLYNELYRKGSIKFQENDRIYLQKKRKKWNGKSDTHKVKPRETMYGISQLYGIRLKHLYQKNRMMQGTEPAIGQVLNLKRKIKRSNIIRLRDPSLDPPADNNGMATQNLENGKNIVDVIRANISAFDMNDRIDAYLRIVAEETPGTPNPGTPNPGTTNPGIPNPNPSTPRPNEPEVVTPPKPHTPPGTLTPPSPSTPNVPTPPATSNGMEYHTVQTGDTLYSISRRFGTTVDDIKQWNNLGSNLISVGQQLRVK